MTPAYAQLLGGGGVRMGKAWIPFAAEKRSQLLAYLAYQGEWVSRDRLVYLFWADRPEEAARRNLRQTLHKLKRLPWLEGLEVEASRLRWRVATDVAAFFQACREEAWENALSLYRGPLLQAMNETGEAEFSSWLELERERLRALWREAVLKRAAQLERTGRYGDAAELLGTLLEQDELDEEALRGYMATSTKAGRQEQALRAYQAFTRGLEDELGLKPSLASRELAEAILRGDGLAPSGPGPPVEETGFGERGLPLAATPFIGRELELTELANLLAQPECRLLTITGAGGAGKSRIALEAAHELATHDDAGVCFVSLEALGEAGLIPTTVAEALALPLRGGEDPLDQVIRHLRNKRLLLILDNFEHLLEGASLVSRLLAHCPRLQALVTSRERLNLQEEWLLPVGGLAFPEEPVETEEASGYDAVALFVQRARRVKPGFRPSERELDEVVEICRLVEGLPLGIELAAVWVRLLSCAEIAREIRQNLDFLASSSRNMPDRQRSIRATFEHSWRLLTAREQEALRRLSAFRGGFRKEAAGYVANVSLPVLASLVDKSLLRMTQAGRYDRHPLLYGYAHEKLLEHPEEAAEMRARHGVYYLAMLEGRDETPFALDEELENILLAWRWAVREVRVNALQPASQALAWYFEMKGRFQEGVERLEEAVPALNEKSASQRRLLGYLRVRQAWLQHWCESERASWLAREGLRLLYPLREHEGVVAGLRVVGIIAWRTGNYRRAEGCFKEALELLDAPDLLALKAVLLDALGMALSALGDYTEAERRHREALAINEGLGNDFQAVHNLINLASFLWRKDPRVALDLAEQALALAERIGFTQYLPFCLAEAGWSRLALGEHREAKALGLEAYSLARQHGNTFALTLSLLLAAQAAIELGELAEAERLLKEALQVAWSLQDLLMTLRALRVGASLALRRGRPEEAALWLEQVRRHPASPHWNVMDAETLLASARGSTNNIEEDALTRAQARGRSMSLGDVVAEILAPSQSHP